MALDPREIQTKEKSGGQRQLNLKRTLPRDAERVPARQINGCVISPCGGVICYSVMSLRCRLTTLQQTNHHKLLQCLKTDVNTAGGPLYGYILKEN